MLIRDARYLIADTETTGLDSAVDRLVEVAGIWTTFDGPNMGWDTLCDPGCPIPAEASAIHHLIDEDVVGQPTPEDALAKMTTLAPFGKVDCLVAHNMAYDWPMIEPCLLEAAEVYPNRLCTYRLALKLWPTLPKHGNQFLRYHPKLAVPRHPDTHRALADATVTAALLKVELKEVLSRSKAPESATIEALIEWVNAPMVLQGVVPFGKHRGQEWKDVPKDYWQWCLRSMEDLDMDRRHTIEFYLRGGAVA